MSNVADMTVFAELGEYIAIDEENNKISRDV